MQIVFVSGVTPIVRDPAASQRFYRDTLGIPFEGVQGDYTFTERLGGVKHLGLWPLAEAAEACFGVAEWPDEFPVPQATMEFDLATAEEVAPAAAELEAAGYRPIHPARTEPWGQTLARVMSPEGLLIGVAHTPWHHEPKA